MDFLVARDELARCQVEAAEPAQLAEGQARLAVAAFGLSANNVTYAKFGDAMAYWSFFPAAAGWGRVPVWGFADVEESRCEELSTGTRVFGYLPPSSELIVTPVEVDERGFADGAPHRAQLPGTYNSYTRVDADVLYDPAREDAQMLLRPLFVTSFLIDDLIGDADLFGARAVILSSASSKTSSGLAFLLAARGGVEVVGLTSASSVDFVRGLGVYDAVLAYEEIDSLPAGRAVYVDMSGNGAVREAVHRRYNDDLVHSAVVGATHHESIGTGPEDLPGPRPQFFFAPDRVAKRSADWGREGFQNAVAEAWRSYVDWTEGWLQVIHRSGAQALEETWLALLEGRVDPATAHVLTLRD
jgi:hypothetical protein